MKIYLSLGANLGNRGETIRQALRSINCLPCTRLLAVASFYETAPWGKIDQPAFLNTAAVVETELPPLIFLHKTQQIERTLGRVRHEHWGARTIDIDLLLAEGCVSATEELRLPHPYMTDRAFVMKPLLDIAPDLVVNGCMVKSWCKAEKILRQEVRLAEEVSDPYPLSMIACVDERLGIGRQGKLLMHSHEDMERFRQETLGQVVIMGRKTLDSLPEGKPLPDRINIVLSKSIQRDDLLICRSASDLWTLLGQLQMTSPHRKFICIGGGEIYTLLLPCTKELLLTEIKGDFEADTFFPAIDEFMVDKREDWQDFSFVRYVRKNSF